MFFTCSWPWPVDLPCIGDMICVTCVCWLVSSMMRHTRRKTTCDIWWTESLRKMTASKVSNKNPVQLTIQLRLNTTESFERPHLSDPKPQLYGDHYVTYCKHPFMNQTGFSWNTVDGRNPAPPGMYETL